MNEAADFKNNRTIHQASIHAGFKGDIDSDKRTIVFLDIKRG